MAQSVATRRQRWDCSKLSKDQYRHETILPPTEYYSEGLAALMATPIDRLQDFLKNFADKADQEHAYQRMQENRQQEGTSV